MANTIKLKRASGSDPSASDLSVGELAIRTSNCKLFSKNDGGSAIGIVAGSADTLTIARTIAGVSFDGSANISLNNNAITNGAGYLADIVSDTSPQLGGNLDLQSSGLTTSTSNGNIKATPNGTGVFEAFSIAKFPANTITSAIDAPVCSAIFSYIGNISFSLFGLFIFIWHPAPGIWHPAPGTVDLG